MPTRSHAWLAFFAVRAAWALTGLACASCSSTAQQNLGGQQCTYQQVISCHGLNGCAGTQICLPDLSGFTECTCGDAASDASRDATGDSR